MVTYLNETTSKDSCYNNLFKNLPAGVTTNKNTQIIICQQMLDDTIKFNARIINIRKVGLLKFTSNE
jgi:hypothetical protein